MCPDGDQSVPPRRDWTGWLFVLFAVAAIIGVLYANGEKDGARYIARPHPVAPPADVVPAAPPMELAPVTLDCRIVEIADLPLYTEDLDPTPPASWTRFRAEIQQDSENGAAVAAPVGEDVPQHRQQFQAARGERRLAAAQGE